MAKLSARDEVRRRILDAAQQQDLVLTHQQCTTLGLSKDMIAREISRESFKRVYPRVYYVSSGRLSWPSLAHAAVLYAGRGAMLSHFSAAYQFGIITTPPRTIDVSIPASRRVNGQRGLRVHRRQNLPFAVRVPPTTLPAQTVVDLLDTPLTTDDHLGIVTAAVRIGTHPRDILHTLEGFTRHRNRQFLLDVLASVKAGVESPLEYRFHRDVEKVHGLPPSVRQVRDVLGTRLTRADVLYEEYGLRVELDGELGHPGGRTSRDMWRDNEADISRQHLTLRYRWRNVAASPCETAAQVGRALQQRGWIGQLKPCGPGCRTTNTR